MTCLFQLTNVGIPLDQVTWSRVTLTSDKWIAIRHGKKREDASRCMVSNLTLKRQLQLKSSAFVIC